MINFHAHTSHSDGDLVPAELIRRAEFAGLAGVGISDHCDFSNIEAVVAAAVAAAAAERASRSGFFSPLWDNGTSPRVPMRTIVRFVSGHFTFCCRLGSRWLMVTMLDSASRLAYSSGMYCVA